MNVTDTAGATFFKSYALKVGGPLPPWPGSASIRRSTRRGARRRRERPRLRGHRHQHAGVLWAVDSGNSLMLRLVWNGTLWVHDTANGWSAGKTLHFPGGGGLPNSEGITFTDAGSAGGVFVSSERNLDAGATSRVSVLRYDVSGAAASLTATQEWNLTPDLPPVGNNAGAEIGGVGPRHLPGRLRLRRQGTGLPYNPANYPNHGTGLFFVGLEANGIVYAYALDQTSSSFDRVATFASGFPTFAAMHFDADKNRLWTVCDDNCEGRSRIFEVNSNGSFLLSAEYRPPRRHARHQQRGLHAHAGQRVRRRQQAGLLGRRRQRRRPRAARRHDYVHAADRARRLVGSHHRQGRLQRRRLRRPRDRGAGREQRRRRRRTSSMGAPPGSSPRARSSGRRTRPGSPTPPRRATSSAARWLLATSTATASTTSRLARRARTTAPARCTSSWAARPA